MTELKTSLNCKDNSSCQILPTNIGLQKEINLLEAVAKGEVCSGYLIWRGQQSIVVPKSLTRKSNFDAASQLSHSRGWPVFVRQTGGDVAINSPGLLNVAVVFSHPASSRLSIQDAYLSLCLPLISALKIIGVDVEYGPIEDSFCDGNYNLKVGEKKLAGTAQRWKKISLKNSRGSSYAILVHALVLCDGNKKELIMAVKNFSRDCDISSDIFVENHVFLTDLIKDDSIKSEALITKVATLIGNKLKHLKSN